ncbi:hypothetical protein [Oerskovia paurometabola]|uniref:Uncharacterized protein n=1 Tax=Oerskovia paurometabola TaxID=162170 RepID=A0ABW1XCP8_9CELL|nr:hypothetical protein [Oerskovia paurometabola]MBM7497132.1 hypothetical protein [Oerskovia paurometabola]
MAQDTVDDGVPTSTPVPTPGDVRTGATASGNDPGDDAVAAALGRLDELAEAPLTHHVAVFDAIHEALQARLADAED